jgi:hypothetical protein
VTGYQRQRGVYGNLGYGKGNADDKGGTASRRYGNTGNPDCHIEAQKHQRPKHPAGFFVCIHYIYPHTQGEETQKIQYGRPGHATPPNNFKNNFRKKITFQNNTMATSRHINVSSKDSDVGSAYYVL